MFLSYAQTVDESILTDFKNETLVLSILPLRIQDFFFFFRKKIFVELKSSISVLNFMTENEIPVSLINVMQDDLMCYPKFNKNKLHNRSVGTKIILIIQHDC